jgi:hypothetical protein
MTPERIQLQTCVRDYALKLVLPAEGQGIICMVAY